MSLTRWFADYWLQIGEMMYSAFSGQNMLLSIHDSM